MGGGSPDHPWSVHAAKDEVRADGEENDIFLMWDPLGLNAGVAPIQAP